MKAETRHRRSREKVCYKCGQPIEKSAGWSPKEGHYHAAGCPEG
ncbi:MAG: hypothetical protein V3U30_03625 [Thermoplasmata archaeon]